MQNIISLIFRYFLSLFPACAGVIPAKALQAFHDHPFPRMCGGDPIVILRETDQPDFSPHVRG